MFQGHRAERRIAVVDAVGALEEPYRNTVLLRYYEGLWPRAIAAQLGVPVKTINTRLHRAHLQLREILDRERRRDGDGDDGDKSG